MTQYAEEYQIYADHLKKAVKYLTVEEKAAAKLWQQPKPLATYEVLDTLIVNPGETISLSLSPQREHILVTKGVLRPVEEEKEVKRGKDSHHKADG